MNPMLGHTLNGYIIVAAEPTRHETVILGMSPGRTHDPYVVASVEPVNTQPDHWSNGDYCGDIGRAMARFRYRLGRAQEDDGKQELIAAIRGVVDAWDGGDLAGAVNHAREVADLYEKED